MMQPNSSQPQDYQAERTLKLAKLKRQAQAQPTPGGGEAYARYISDPVGYARDVLEVFLWSKQIEIAESVRDNRKTVVYAGHAVGKTHAVGGLVQWHFDCFDPSITLTTAPTWSSVHDLLWGEIKSQRKPDAPGRLLDIRLDGGPMHYAKGHNADSGAGFQGRHEARQLIVLDEAMGIPPYIWEATNAMMTAPDCRVLVLGNPTETSGEYYEIREDPSWNIITISCLEHPNIASELSGLVAPYPKAVSLIWLQEMITKHCQPADVIDADCFEFPPESGIWYRPNDIFRSRVLGLFPLQAASSVWSEAWLLRARTQALEWRDVDIPRLGVDVARFGDDETVMYAGRGPCVTHRESHHKKDTMETVGRIGKLVEQVVEYHAGAYTVKQVQIAVDDTGLGGGVTDRLRELEYTVIPVNAGEAARDPHEYYNRRSELWFVASHRGRDMQLDLTRLSPEAYRKLSAELRAVRYKIQSDKTLRVESKADYKKRVGRSPDDADAFNLWADGGHAPPLGTLPKSNPKTPSRFTSGVTGGRWQRGQRG